MMKNSEFTPKLIKASYPHTSPVPSNVQFGVYCDKASKIYDTAGMFAHSCRNQFPYRQRMNESARKYYFAISTPERLANIRRLIYAVEKHLNFEKSKITIGHSAFQRDRFMTIIASKQWRETMMRASLLTFLIKNGSSYNNVSLNEWFITKPSPNAYMGYWMLPKAQRTGVEQYTSGGLNAFHDGETLRANLKLLFGGQEWKTPLAMDEVSWKAIPEYSMGFGISETLIKG